MTTHEELSKEEINKALNVVQRLNEQKEQVLIKVLPSLSQKELVALTKDQTNSDKIRLKATEALQVLELPQKIERGKEPGNIPWVPDLYQESSSVSDVQVGDYFEVAKRPGISETYNVEVLTVTDVDTGIILTFRTTNTDEEPLTYEYGSRDVLQVTTRADFSAFYARQRRRSMQE